MSAEEEAAKGGLALVKCYGNVTGYKNVGLNNGNFYALVGASKGRKKKRYLGPYSTPEDAALALARDQEWGAAKTCDCLSCIAAAAPPAPTSLTEPEVEDLARRERLTIARTEESCRYKSIYKLRNRFAIQAKVRSSLDAADTERLPPSFATAQEAALALARCLGPDGSVTHAEVIKPLTEEEIAHCMERTDNGEAFGGLFGGGYTCEGYPYPNPNPYLALTPNPGPRALTLTLSPPQPYPYPPPLTRCEACHYDHPKSRRCGLFFRSHSYAAQGGRVCCADSLPKDAKERVLAMGTDPVGAERDDRGCYGRRFVWEGADDESGSSSVAEGGSYVHHCLFKDCGHTVKGFGRWGYDREWKIDPLIKKVWKHERDDHGDMPMTKEEVEEACCEQPYPGTAVVHTWAKGLAFRRLSCLLGLARPCPTRPLPPS